MMNTNKGRIATFMTIGMFLIAQAIGVPILSHAGGGAPGHGRGKAEKTQKKEIKNEHRGDMPMSGDHDSKSGDTHQKEDSTKEDVKPIIISMDAIHAYGGTPPGWKFRIPAGDPEEGREAFVKMECFSCPYIGGEKFPKIEKNPANIGPDLTGMGSMHGEPTYFFESIVNPNRVILKGPGYIKKGLSIMPNYSDSIGLQEAIDLVAYLTSLKGGHKKMGGEMHAHGSTKTLK